MSVLVNGVKRSECPALAQFQKGVLINCQTVHININVNFNNRKNKQPALFSKTIFNNSWRHFANINININFNNRYVKNNILSTYVFHNRGFKFLPVNKRVSISKP
ncbi:hypothetical protein scyTo_0004163 [Scyliorhinus torazame]|uniref:Uncharacterized protein n=1 Tax=Scyliorhinus torazame TaxID=75743 RepID=A0A401NLW1_SCYTO|nr:hypothetical protein [Scyliorhinus torazame]